MLKNNGQFKLILHADDKTIDVHCDAYNPDQTSYVNLRFGVLKNGQKSEHNAGILQWLSNYRAPPEKLQKKEHLATLDGQIWKIFSERIKERHFFLGGIPMELLPDPVRKVLEQEGLMESV